MRYIPEYIVNITDDGKISRRLPKFEDFISNGWLEPMSTVNMHLEQHVTRKDTKSVSKLRKGDFEGYNQEYVRERKNARRNEWGFNLEVFDSVFNGDSLTIRLKDRDLHQWDGEKVKHILVISSDGYGDAFLTLRYIPPLLQFAETVSVIVPSAIRYLVNRNMPMGVRVYSKDDGVKALYQADVWSSVESLLYLAKQGYGQSKWIDWKPNRNDKTLRVGIVWAGTKSNQYNKLRSIPIDKLSPLFELSGIEWHSLQVGDYAYQCPDNVIDRSSDIKSWTDTVNIISTLDLVISVDTGTANLTGAMGFPLWVMVESFADFRWGNDGDSTPWFDSARVFRQSEPELWDDVISNVKNALMQWKEVM